MNTLRSLNLSKIRSTFTKISAYIELNNATGLTDLNKSMEDFFIFILNRIINANLINANYDSLNYPAIDLYDLNERKAVQITSQDSSDKKKDTCNKFYENELNKKFDILYILFIKMNAKLNPPKLKNNRQPILCMKDLRRLYLDIWALPDTCIQKIVDYIEENLIEESIFPIKFINPKKIEIKKEDIKSFIYKSGQFLGGDNEEDEVNRTVSTYNDLFNIVNKLSLGSRQLLVYVISNTILGNSKINSSIQSYYIFTDTLFNHFGNLYRTYANELIEKNIAFYDSELMKSLFGSYSESLGIYYKGDLEDGNAFAFLNDYLGYDYEKLKTVLVDLDFSSLR